MKINTQKTIFLASLLCLLSEKPAFSQKEFTIVALDGGGTRGGSVLVEDIRRWQELTGRNFQCDVNMMFGTSMGGILALALAQGHDVQDCYELLIEGAPGILRDGFIRKLETVGGLLASKYPRGPLDEALQGFFGDQTLSSISGMYVGATTWNEDLRSPKYLTNWDYMADIPGLPGSTGEDVPLWKAAAKTGAAPTYWDPIDGCIDGGVFANNPASIAWTLGSQLMSKGIQHSVLDPAQDSCVVKLYSFGTGTVEGQAHHSAHLFDTNLIHQGLKVIDIATSTVAVEKQMDAQFVGKEGRYYRFSPELKRQVPLDEANVDILKEVATWTRVSYEGWNRRAEFEESLKERHSFGIPLVQMIKKSHPTGQPDEDA